jgi:hypothetical protein
MIPPTPVLLADAGLSAEQEIARDVVYTMKPSLRRILADLRAISEAWNTPSNNIDGKIATAHANGTALANYSARTWDQWGQTFQAIMVMINTPIEIIYRDGSTATITPAQVLATRDERID